MKQSLHRVIYLIRGNNSVFYRLFVGKEELCKRAGQQGLHFTDEVKHTLLRPLEIDALSFNGLHQI